MFENPFADLPVEQQQKIGRYIRGIFEGRGKQEKAEKVERFRHLNPMVKKGQVVFAGSSLMEQFPIYELLLDEGLPYVIYNRGVGGFTTSEMLEVMGPCVYDLEPSVLFLNIGTNDLNDAEFDEEAFAGRYRQILDGIKEHLPETKVFLMAFYPVNPVVGGEGFMAQVFKNRTNERIKQASALVVKLAAEYGHAFIDVNEGLYDEAGNLKAEYTIEGMHMYADGYKVVLDNLKPILENL